MSVSDVYCGIDVSAKRDNHLCALRPSSNSRLEATFYEPGGRAALVRTLGALRPDVVAIDAPQGLRLNLLAGDSGLRAELGIAGGKYERSRVCDALLIKRSLFLYHVPDRVEDVPDWMKQGFALFADLEEQGFSRYRPEGNGACEGQTSAEEGPGRLLVETFPDAAFCALLAERPQSKGTPAGMAARLRALADAGITDKDDRLAQRSHDELDACAAALTAHRLSRGEACWLGSPEEGVMVLPVTDLEDTYKRAASSVPREPLS